MIIPIFIPELACPNQCIFCNQRTITGQVEIPSYNDIRDKIKKYIKSTTDTYIEVAFFGGNFTGIPLQQQIELLKVANEFLSLQVIHGIRVSTRPDYINESVIQLLKSYNVTVIELGAQSFDNDVLKKSERGYDSTCIEKAATLIKANGFKLGLQMMIGLPGDSSKKVIATAKKIVELKADSTRIYPVLVIKQTALERMYLKNEYTPLTLEVAIEQCKHVVPIFEDAGVLIQKIGLHPSADLVCGTALIAGPFHPNFRELVYSSIWKDLLKPHTEKDTAGLTIQISCAADQLNYAIGYAKSNTKMLKEKYRQVRITSDPHLTGRNFNVTIQ